ncbi:QRFP-like peptide receptor [Physella acuta]|uniref:QRFP-like peptide receptor n=1 Tax=Physella acuta TaxID=109671 RepID=UPI0027DB230D|nr:QRFP-like peptide receptor [Physella acuta]
MAFRDMINANIDNSDSNMTNATDIIVPMYITVWVIFANILVFLVGVLGNLLVIIVVLCVREMKTATNLCLMNLSVADLLVLIICQPSSLLEFFYEEIWLIGNVMCKLVNFLESFVTVASILIILMISLERFWAVYYPLKTHTSGSRSKAMITIAVVWVIAAVAASPFLVMAHTETTPHVHKTDLVEVCVMPMVHLWERIYLVCSFVLIFVIPMLLLVFLYNMIIHKVISETMECKQMTESAKSQSQQNRRQLVIMLVGIIVLFFVCLLPFRILGLYQVFALSVLTPECYLNVINFCRLLVYINSAGNPIIYNIVSTKFRRAFHKVLRLYCCCCKKRILLSRGAMNGTYSHDTRMTTMSHYSTVKQDMNDGSDTGDAV